MYSMKSTLMCQSQYVAPVDRLVFLVFEGLKAI